MTAKSKIGRPPRYEKAMLKPITLRLPVPIVRRLEKHVNLRKMKDGADKTQIIRELISSGLDALDADQR
jgi:hypothetical protein